MTSPSRPNPLMRKLLAKPRVADRAAALADVRNRSVTARVVRRAARFPERPIPMFWFKGFPNLGDALSPVIVEYMSNGTPLYVSGRGRGKLLAAGSVLHKLTEGDSVWGTGALRDVPMTPPPGVKIYAVRGPLTRGLLKADVPEIYGDPAMLLPRFYTPRSEKRFEVGVLPHHVDRQFVQVTDPSISTIDVSAEWRIVVDQIAECQTILSSSLHGLIVAEAYGIPAVWMSVTDKVVGEGFKFRDYYLSTGREAPTPLRWDGALSVMDRRLAAPPWVDMGPLLRAWPKELTFPPFGVKLTQDVESHPR